MATLAGTIITRVRDLVPDPIYSGAVPQPDADGGLFRATTLYGWLDDGVKLLAAASNWTLTDWYAMALSASIGNYAVSPLWTVLDQAYCKALRLKLEPQNDAVNVYPDRVVSPQPNRAFIYRATDRLELGIDPPAIASDPSTFLAGAITAASSALPLASTAGFLPYGYVYIVSSGEVVQYGALSGNTLIGITRGAGGTVAAAAPDGAAVVHLALWVKGLRVPMGIVNSLSPVEVPLAWVSILNSYLLAQCLESQQETQRAMVHQRRFDTFLEAIGRQLGARDPITKQPQPPEPGLPPAPMPAAAMQPGG